ncbi:MAG: TonB family protein [Gammaproteobacteria bacterium]
MGRAIHVRFIPAAMTAVVIGFLLQLLMQSLIQTTPAPAPPAESPVDLQIAAPPPKPVVTTVDPNPPPPAVKRPSLEGLTQIDTVDVVLPPAAPTHFSPGAVRVTPGEPGRFLSSPTLPDQAARATTPLLPSFPERAKRLGRSGVVTASFTVLPDGSASDIDIEAVEPRNLGFEQAVRRTLLRARFNPATAQGTAVATRLRQRFVFELDDN